jgi:signal transduction histidine kinase
MNDGIPGCCNIRRGEYLELTVSDNGKGMKKEILEKIFEPFFTTKNTEGLGLGLSVVNDIVSSLKGGMAVNSAYEKGTTFRIYLPKAKSEKFEKFLDK